MAGNSVNGVGYACYSSGTRVNGGIRVPVSMAGIGYPVPHRQLYPGQWHIRYAYGYQWRRVSAMRGTDIQYPG